MDGRYLIVFFFDRWDVGSERWGGGGDNVGIGINDIPAIYKIFPMGPDIVYTSFWAKEYGDSYTDTPRL